MRSRLFLQTRKRPFRLSPGRRLYAIGDVHGRLDLLNDLLERIRVDTMARGAAETGVILLGDMIDRGPDSRGVLHRLMTPLGWAGMTAVRGNHEALLLDAIRGNAACVPMWLRHGGRDTLSSWGVDVGVQHPDPESVIARLRTALTPEEVARLDRLPTSLRIDDYVFVHAGIRPGVPLRLQRNDDLLWIRDDFLKSQRDHGAMIVHGHSAGNVVEQRPNRINLDTGAYITGELTTLGIEGEERWFLSTNAKAPLPEAKQQTTAARRSGDVAALV